MYSHEEGETQKLVIEIQASHSQSGNIQEEVGFTVKGGGHYLGHLGDRGGRSRGGAGGKQAPGDTGEQAVAARAWPS